MKLMRMILCAFSLMLLTSPVIAVTCKDKFDNRPFRLVALYFDDGYRCVYGKDPYSGPASSYEVLGSFTPSPGGYWEGTSEPNAIVCRGSAASCVLQEVRKPICCH